MRRIHYSRLITWLLVAALGAGAGPAFAGRAGASDVLAFTEVGKNGAMRLVTSDLHGGHRRQIEKGLALAPSFSPDGRQLAYLAYPTPGSWSFTIVLTDRYGHHRRPLTAGPGWVTSLSWSPDGRYLAYGLALRTEYSAYRVGAIAGACELDVIEVRTQKRRTVLSWGQHGVAGNGVDLFAGGDLGCPSTVSWSPRGDLIAVNAQSDGYVIGAGQFRWAAAWHLFTVRPDGTGLTPLPVADASLGVAFSPDGTQISYPSYDYVSGKGALHVIRPDGTGQRVIAQMPNGVGVTYPVWSPKGDAILAEVDDYRHGWRAHLVRFPLRGGPSRHLVADAIMPAWHA